MKKRKSLRKILLFNATVQPVLHYNLETWYEKHISKNVMALIL